jgi:hypothetical protein
MGSFGYDSVITVDQGRQLTLNADKGCGGVVLDALHKGYFFNVGYYTPSPSSASLVLQGLTLRNGLGEGGSRSPSHGGAVLVINGTLTTKDCRLEHCTADFGGAIALDSTKDAVLHATNTTFFNNSANGPGGDVVVEDGGSATFSNCTFLDSSAGAPGGAVSVEEDTIEGSSSVATFTNCIFTGCSSAAPGGALTVSGSVTITDSTFTGCTCSGAPGGAIAIGGGNFTLTNCIFADNTCSANGQCGSTAGGAIWSYAGGLTNFSLTLEGCKFVVPANPSAGNNDLYTWSGTTTFACPPGTKGTPVTLPAGPYLIKQLPPSTEIVHCV